MSRDPSIRHNHDKDEAEMRLNALKEKHPNDYYKIPEWGRLCEKIRMANIHIRQVDRMKRNGVKF